MIIWMVVVFLAESLMLSAVAIAEAADDDNRVTPGYVFYGTREFDERAAQLPISKEEAFRLALEKAREDERLRDESRVQYVPRDPVLLHGNLYVFSAPHADGVNLKGYHVDGRTGITQFYMVDEIHPKPPDIGIDPDD